MSHPLAVPLHIGTSPAFAIGTPPARPTAPTAPSAVANGWVNVSSSQRVSPPALRGGGLVFDPVDNYLVYFGGCAANVCPAPAQTWKYAGGAWSNITSSSGQPPARSSAAFAYDSKDGYAVLFGGWGTGGRLLGDTWEFSGGVWTNVTGTGTSPSPRGGAGLVYDRANNYLVLFGGCAFRSCPRADTWQFVGGLWKDITGMSSKTPPARVGAAFAWDDHDGYALLFGGDGGGGSVLADSWQFVGGSWSSVALNGTSAPPGRTNATIAFYNLAGAVYLGGGAGGAGLLSDTWKYATNRWVDVSAMVGPNVPARSGAASLGSNIAWTTFASKHVGFLVVFGGGLAGCTTCARPVFNDTWVFEPPLSATVSAIPSTVETGQPLQLSAAGAGGTTPYLYLWQFGDGTSAVAPTPAHSYRMTGVFDANVSLTDAAGAIYRMATPVTVVAGPAVAIHLSETHTDVGRPVMFSGGASGGVPPYAYHWSFGDFATATTVNASHAFANPGTFTGNLTAADAIQGIGVSAFTVVIAVGLGLTSSVPSVPIDVGQPVNFSAAPSLGTPPYSVDWSFGDGASSYIPLASHTYKVPGLYPVRLSVADTVGWTIWQNFTVRVLAAPATPTGPSGFFGLPSWTPWAMIGGVAGVAVVLSVFYVRRRRLRSRVAPIAAIAAGQPGWNDDSEGWSRSRSARRTAERRGRR